MVSQRLRCSEFLSQFPNYTVLSDDCSKSYIRHRTLCHVTHPLTATLELLFPCMLSSHKIPLSNPKCTELLFDQSWNLLYKEYVQFQLEKNVQIYKQRKKNAQVSITPQRPLVMISCEMSIFRSKYIKYHDGRFCKVDVFLNLQCLNKCKDNIEENYPLKCFLLCIFS